MYVSDWFNHRIQKFDAAGNFVASWGGYGTANGSYIFPRGIEVRSDGTVVVTDSENNRIDLLTSSGSFVQSIKPSGTQTKFLRPHQTAVSPNGTYWVADTGNNRIVRIDAAGTVVQNWNNGNTITAPRGIAVDENGDVYVANSGNYRIEKYSVTGTRLAILATNGTGPGQVKNPYGLRIVGTGANALLLVADRGNNRIQVFRLDGTPVTRFGTVGSGNGQLQQPQGVARNPLTGEIAVADFTNNRLSVWSTT
jgi:DNA-binding beta-propeller fold protein YncE